MKVVLTIAGSDSSGGAGIQADLKSFEAFGVFGTSAITVLTAQNTQGVDSLFALPSSFVIAQIQSVLDDFEVAAIKIGMLYDSEIIRAVSELIAPLNIPIVLDPVCISKAGSSLLKDEAIDALFELSKKVTLSTPNLHEAHRLFGYSSGDTDSLQKLLKHPSPVLIKNHIAGKISADLLYFGYQKRVFASELIETQNLHGTGCSFSSAIAANLALGHTLEASIARSKAFIARALRHAPSIGHGAGPINHKAGGKDVA
ncbi:MAG: bifunctional hydroxymethylpyrimidine kinase/phosphomethylpyrimidine kinase [Campylobacterales bacterium]|nr:bifunctional hydroxymethylpyrimidine kinase/phosphomethylpyrimidine kinase [Campylobacterales bacterium]